MICLVVFWLHGNDAGVLGLIFPNFVDPTDCPLNQEMLNAIKGDDIITHNEIDKQPDFVLVSTLSFSLAQSFAPWLFPQFWQCHPESFDWQRKQLSSIYSKLLFDSLESNLALQRQLLHDTWGVDVWLLSNPVEHALHSKLSSKCSLHLMHEIVPLDNTLHAADDRFLRHQVQWKSNFSVKSTKKGKMQCFT